MPALDFRAQWQIHRRGQNACRGTRRGRTRVIHLFAIQAAPPASSSDETIRTVLYACHNQLGDAAAPRSGNRVR